MFRFCLATFNISLYVLLSCDRALSDDEWHVRNISRGIALQWFWQGYTELLPGAGTMLLPGADILTHANLPAEASAAIRVLRAHKQAKPLSVPLMDNALQRVELQAFRRKTREIQPHLQRNAVRRTTQTQAENRHQGEKLRRPLRLMRREGSCRASRRRCFSSTSTNH